jgi:UDP-N-acetylglucosamine diphosphorylase/glucosamine-1-phosphate N-acetyltransferase
MKIVLFESEDFALLYPLTYLRPVFELRCGALTLRQKVQEKFPDCELHLETRPALSDVAAELYGPGAANNEERLKPNDDVLLVNAGAILTAEAGAYAGSERAAVTPEGDFVWAYLAAETVAELNAESARQLAARAAERFMPAETDDVLIKYPWDLITHNADEIARDFAAAFGPRAGEGLDQRVAVRGDEANLHVAQNVEIGPWSLIDCRSGPVIIGEGVVVGERSSIEGPAAIGPQTQLFAARVREGTSIGPACRVGGEVEGSILHGYLNKYHTGFLGHAYVGEWVNLGALTTNSDLKNDYSTVSVPLGGQPVETGSMKVGSFIGDHTKTSIGTLLNTGTVVGIMCNLVGGGGLLPKYVPSFSWWLQGRISKGFGLASGLETARAAMARRGVELTNAMADLIRYTEQLTRPERMKRIKRDRRKAFR